LVLGGSDVWGDSRVGVPRERSGALEEKDLCSLCSSSVPQYVANCKERKKGGEGNKSETGKFCGSQDSRLVSLREVGTMQEGGRGGLHKESLMHQKEKRKGRQFFKIH